MIQNYYPNISIDFKVIVFGVFFPQFKGHETINMGDDVFIVILVQFHKQTKKMFSTCCLFLERAHISNPYSFSCMCAKTLYMHARFQGFTLNCLANISAMRVKT